MATNRLIPIRARGLIALALAWWIVLLIGPSTASAAMSVDSGPTVRVNPHQVTIWWHSSSTGSSELRWDTANKGAFASFANDVSNVSPTLGTLHSRTISNLPAGTYSFRARTTGASGTATTASRSFVVEPVNAVTPFGSLTFNGSVHASAFDAAGTTLYLGGSFTNVQERVGGGALIDPVTAAQRPGLPQIWGSNGYDACWLEENVAVPDGSGGWYLGGDFTHVGGLVRAGLAHLLPDGGVDPYWSASTDESVCAMQLIGSTLYVGGDFSTINGAAREGLAALEAASPTTSGQVLAFDAGLDGSVWALEADATNLYIGGRFSTVNGSTPRNHMAAVNLTTATATAFDPDLDDAAYEIEISGSTIYVSGWFSTVNGGGVSRSGLAAFDATTSAATAWDPDPWGEVWSMEIDGSTMYLGGVFSHLNGGAFVRNNVGAVDLTTGAATAWDPNANDVVHSVQIVGSIVYIGGEFSVINGTARSHAAAVDKTTAAVAAWNPSPNDSVDTIQISGGDAFIGGEFSGLGAGTTRNRLLAIDAATGALTNWNPNANGSVYALAISGSTVYVGGAFTTVNGATVRKRLAAIDASSGTATVWNPNANSTVYTVVPFGAAIYAGGSFTTVNGATGRTRIAAFNNTNGTATAWTPSANSTVYAVAPTAASIYVGGAFTTVTGAVARNRIAALDPATAAAQAWNPNADNDVYAITVDGTDVYAGGRFANVNGATARKSVAKFTTASAVATAWDATLAGFGTTTVRSIAIDGSSVLLGGTFGKSIGGNYYNDFLGVTTSTGSGVYGYPEVDGQAATVGATGGVGRTIAVSSSNLFVGGPISSAGLWHSGATERIVNQHGGALFRRRAVTGVPNDSGSLTISTTAQHDVSPYQTSVWWSTSASASSELVWDTQSRPIWSDYRHDASNTATNLGTLHSRTISNLPQGAYFYRVRSRDASGNQVTSSEYSFRVDPPDAATPLGSTSIDGIVYDVVDDGSRTYIGGSFGMVGERLGNGIEIDPTTSARVNGTGAPQVAGRVITSIPDGLGGFYIGGEFTHVGGLSRSHVAHLLPDGGVDPTFDPGTGPDDDVYALAISGSRLYLGGYFTSYTGTPRNYLVAVDATTAAVDTGFNPGTGASSSVYALEVSGARLYLGGSFTTYNGTARSRIAAVSTTTAALDAGFNPGTGFSSTVTSLDASGARLYAGGYFTSYNGTTRNRLAAIDTTTAAVDVGFNTSIGANNTVNSIQVSGSRVYLGGDFTSYGGTGRARIAAASSTSGALDAGFNPGAGANSIVEAVSVVGSKVIVGGWFSMVAGTARPNIAALDSTTGALDGGFNPGTGFDSRPLTMASNGTDLFVGGWFTTYRGTPRTNLAALDSRTMVIDTTFTSGTGPNDSVLALAVSGSRVYISGYFNSYAGTARAGLAALDATTAALDAGFNPGTGPNGYVGTMAVSGTRIYLGGGFTAYNGTARNRIAAVNATTGALDAGFNPGTGANNQVTDLVADSGKVYLAGGFTSYNGTARGHIAAVDAITAALDVGFAAGSGADDWVYDIVLDGSSFYIGGFFYDINGTARDRVARIDRTSGATDPTFDAGPEPSFTSYVSAIGVHDRAVFIAYYDGMHQGTMRAVDAATGAASDVLGGDLPFIGEIERMRSSGDRLLVAGTYSKLGQISQGGVASLDTCDRATFCDDEALRDYVTISVPATVSLGSSMPVTSATATLDATVQTNAFNGYSLLAFDESNSTAMSCSVGGCAGQTIPDWTGTDTSPSVWPESGANYGFGVTVLSSTLQAKNGAKWGTGSAAADFVYNRYAGLDSGTSTTLHAPDRYVANTPDVTKLGLRARVMPTQAPGSYSGTISLTVVANP